MRTGRIGNLMSSLSAAHSAIRGLICMKWKEQCSVWEGSIRQKSNQIEFYRQRSSIIQFQTFFCPKVTRLWLCFVAKTNNTPSLFLSLFVSPQTHRPYLSSLLRETLADYALPLAIIVFSLIGSLAFKQVHGKRNHLCVRVCQPGKVLPPRKSLENLVFQLVEP